MAWRSKLVEDTTRTTKTTRTASRRVRQGAWSGCDHRIRLSRRHCVQLGVLWHIVSISIALLQCCPTKHGCWFLPCLFFRCSFEAVSSQNPWHWKKFYLKLSCWQKVSSNSISQMRCAFFSVQEKFYPHCFSTKNLDLKKFCLKLSFAKKSSSSILQITCAFFLQKENFTHIFCPQTFLPKSKREVKSKNVTNKVSYGNVLNFKNPAISTIFWCWHFGTKVSTPLFKETFYLGSTQYIKVFNFRSC